MSNKIPFMFGLLCSVAYLAISWGQIRAFVNRILRDSSWHMIMVLVLLFFSLHIVKFLRYYLIISESHLLLGQYLRAYLLTTLVNILIPFKMGEIFRFFVMGKKIQSKRKSFLSIITERFFDTIIIVILLAYHTLFIQGIVDNVLFFFLFFVIIVLMVYVLFPSASLLLNKHYIAKRPMQRDIYILKLFNTMDQWHIWEQQMIKGKGLLIIFFSGIAWLLEYGFFWCLATITLTSYNLSTFASYISSILEISADFPRVFITAYSLLGIIVFLGLYVMANTYSKFKRWKIA